MTIWGNFHLKNSCCFKKNSKYFVKIRKNPKFNFFANNRLFNGFYPITNGFYFADLIRYFMPSNLMQTRKYTWFVSRHRGYVLSGWDSLIQSTQGVNVSFAEYWYAYHPFFCKFAETKFLWWSLIKNVYLFIFVSFFCTRIGHYSVFSSFHTFQMIILLNNL